MVDVRVPSALAIQASTFRLDLCQPMAPALPVGERGFRQVPVSWAALKQAAACQWAVSHGAVPKAQGASKCFNDNQREPVTEPHLSSSRPMRPVRWRPGLRSPDVRAGPYRGAITNVRALPRCHLFRSGRPFLNFRFFECEQFDTELSVRWVPNELCWIAITRAKWLMRCLIQRYSISSATPWMRLGDE